MVVILCITQVCVSVTATYYKVSLSLLSSQVLRGPYWKHPCSKVLVTLADHLCLPLFLDELSVEKKNGNGFFSRKPVCRSSHIMSSTGHSKLSTISYGSCFNGQTVHHEHPSFYLHYPLQTSLVHLLWATHWWDLVKLTYLCTILSVAVWHYSSK